MKKVKPQNWPLIIVCFLPALIYSQIQVLSSETKEPVSFATVSFENGYGLFADDEGVFVFNEKLYPNIDSLSISALGFKNYKVASGDLPEKVFLETDRAQLDEVMVYAKIDRDFKEETLEPYLDSDYYKSWLPTIESEIAVYFENEGAELKKLSKIHLPLTLESKDWTKRKKSNSEKKPFSTLFKLKVYANDNGFPGKSITNETMAFRVTEKNGDEYIYDVENKNIFIPEDGIFISIQVLGYTDKNGKLLPNKKYKEIKSRGAVVRIPTNFRPLLPFTDKIESEKTFIKRVFIDDNEWVKFNSNNVSDSSLLRNGLNNYGMGISFNVYEDE